MNGLMSNDKNTKECTYKCNAHLSRPETIKEIDCISLQRGNNFNTKCRSFYVCIRIY